MHHNLPLIVAGYGGSFLMSYLLIPMLVEDFSFVCHSTSRLTALLSSSYKLDAIFKISGDSDMS